MSHRASLPALPAEVWDAVLDWLRGNTRTLSICCRVCQGWSSRARYNLYHTV
ncbi:hypothetical protein BV20DRAFT_920771, partial [Pilatotrama ljubarskyi]